MHPTHDFSNIRIFSAFNQKDLMFDGKYHAILLTTRLPLRNNIKLDKKFKSDILEWDGYADFPYSFIVDFLIDFRLSIDHFILENNISQELEFLKDKKVKYFDELSEEDQTIFRLRFC